MVRQKTSLWRNVFVGTVGQDGQPNQVGWYNEKPKHPSFATCCRLYPIGWLVVWVTLELSQGPVKGLELLGGGPKGLSRFLDIDVEGGDISNLLAEPQNTRMGLDVFTKIPNSGQVWLIILSQNTRYFKVLSNKLG